MNAKISVLLLVLKRSYICYYITCMTVTLSSNLIGNVFLFMSLYGTKYSRMDQVKFVEDSF